MSLRLFDQIRHEPAYSDTAISEDIKTIHMATLAIIPFIYLYIERITKTLIRMQGCTGWSAPLLFVCNKIEFSGDAVNIM